MYKHLLLSLITFFMIGCAGGYNLSAPSNNSGSLPSWFVNPKISNGMYYYSTATGSTLDEAKINAFNQIAGEISVELSSTLDIKKISSDAEYKKTIEKETKTSISKIKFTDSEILNNKFINNKFYIQMRISKRKLFDSRKKEFDLKYSQLENKMDNINKYGVFELLKDKDASVSKSIDKLLSDTLVLKLINSSFNDSYYTQKLTSLKKELEDKKTNVSIYIKSNNALPYAEVLKKYISKEGFTLINNKNKVDKNTLFLLLSKSSKKKNVKTSDPRLKNAIFAEVIVKIKVKDLRNKVLSQNQIKLINISKENFAEASNKTSKFERKLKRDGVLDFIIN